MKSIFNVAPLFLCVLFLAACKKDKTPLELPTTYLSADYAANTSEENALRGQLAALTAMSKTGVSTQLSYDGLLELYQGGTPSLEDKSAVIFNSKIVGISRWLYEISAASGQDYSPSADAQNGGAYGAYLFNKYGLEPTQVIDKGLYGGLFYRDANNYLHGISDVAAVDKLVALFGAHPDFPNTPNAPENPDGLLANYAAQRDNNDGTGMYFQMKNAFIKLRTAVEAGDEFQDEELEALSTIQTTWERINFATAYYYCSAAFSQFTKTNPSEEDLSKGLHAYAEAVGFILGFYPIDTDNKQITDLEIEDMLIALQAPINGEPSSYLFVTDAFSTVDNLRVVMDKIQTIYGFSEQEKEDYKVNWVAIQGR